MCLFNYLFELNCYSALAFASIGLMHAFCFWSGMHAWLLMMYLKKLQLAYCDGNASTNTNQRII
ncbi:hypothetical protein RchiOBHm_Chr5g0019011 [Rosa chinensis]|uniref:Uncharacterized protein n=1 Tax=Rosa chinensis TaxID=74649 RepID=A0A2P6Q6X5_ROSCH|nr:hypothetical protein RchiOBHm_Chr5g0019011 [Rosa chinensis]